MKFTKMIIALVLMSTSSALFAASFKDGYEAAQASDYKKAAQIWQRLAKQGNAEAQFNLASMYESGAAGVFNEKMAVKWFKKAAKNGSMHARQYLVVGYREGWFGLTKNESKARYWEKGLVEE